MIRDMPPLTPQERDFAAEHYFVVQRYLRIRKLPYDEYHDDVILHYLHAVRKWLTDDSLHQYAFATIAYYAMRNGLSNRFKRERIRQVTSLDAPVGDTDDLCLMDIIPDPNDTIKRFEDRELVRELLEFIHPAKRAALFEAATI